MQSQFDHLAETYFSGYEFDLGERELGFALSVDHDFEMFAASVGLIKTSVQTVMKDEDVEVDMGDHDPDEEFFTPLQNLLDQCRSARVLSKCVSIGVACLERITNVALVRKLVKRVEDLTQESAALKSRILPQLQALVNVIPELGNFGISVRQCKTLLNLTLTRAIPIGGATTHSLPERCPKLEIRIPAQYCAWICRTDCIFYRRQRQRQPLVAGCGRFHCRCHGRCQ